MKKKQLIILIVLVAVVGGAGWYLYQQKNESWESSDQQMGSKLIKDFPLNDVAQIRVRNQTNQVDLVKTNDAWTVAERGHYPANFKDISDLVQKVWQLKIVQPQYASESQLARYDLLPPDKGGTNAATVVEFKDKNGKGIHTLRLGKQHLNQSGGDSPFGGGGWANGRYVMVGNDPKTVALVSEAFSNVEPDPQHWLNKDFFKIEKIKSVSVTFPEATNSWTLSRESESGSWTLAGLKPIEELDTSKTSSVGNAFSYPSFTDVVPPGSKPEETGLDHPTTAVIDTFEGLAYTLKIGSTNEQGNYYFQIDVAGNFPKERAPGKDEKPEDKEKLDKEFQDKTKTVEEKLKKEEAFEKWTYLLPKYTVEPVLKHRGELVKEKQEKKDETKPAEKPAAAKPPVPPLPPLKPAPEPEEKPAPKAEEKPAPKVEEKPAAKP